MTDTTRVTGSIARRVSFRRRGYHNAAWRMLTGARAALVPPIATPRLARALGLVPFAAPRHRR